MTTQEKIKKTVNIADISRSIGLSSLVIIENEENRDALVADKVETFKKDGFKEAKDYLEIMNGLEMTGGKIVYVEQNDKLNNLVLEIVTEFGAGIISLADRKNSNGLKTVKFNPFEISFIVIMTRSQIEKSYPKLFEYIGATESI